MMTPIRLDCLNAAEHALHKFVSLVPELYGVQHVTFNVHLLTHLAASVRRWGPLSCSSAFFFEDANGKLLTYFHGTRGVAKQIFRSFIGGTHLRKLVQLYVTDSSAMNVIDRIVNIASVCKHATKFGQNTVCLGFSSQRALTAAETVAIQNVIGCSHFSADKISAYRRVLINGNLLHTESYSRSVRNSDCYFSVLSRSRTYTLSGIVIVEFCMSTDCNAVHDIRKEVMLIAYPVAETVLQTYDNDLKVNLSAHIRKAVVDCLLYTSPSPRDGLLSRMPSSA